MLFRSKLMTVIGRSLVIAVVPSCSGGSDTPRYEPPAQGACNNNSSNQGSGGYGLAEEASWSKVKTIIEDNCLSCHPGYDAYDKAKEWGTKLVARVELDESDDKFMPQNGDKLSLDDRKTLILWEAADFPKEDLGFGSGSSSGGNDDDDRWGDDNNDDDNNKWQSGGGNAGNGCN